MLFSEVIGQEEVKQRLVRSLQTGRVSHAQLFTGNTGYGTMALALAFAQYLFCTGEKKDDACGACLSCRQMQKLVHPDLHFVFPVVRKSKTPVSDDYIREWREMLLTNAWAGPEEWLAAMGAEENAQAAIYTEESAAILRKLTLKAFESDYKVMIIWLPEKMNSECANKLLKILEEPFDKTVFLLVSEEPDRLLNTIRSRTQQIAVPPIEKAVISRQLMAEKGIAETKAAEYAHVAAGNWRRAVSLLNESEEQADRQELFARLMRLCWLRKMLPVNEWVNEMTGLGRERQKSFLVHSLHVLRESFVRNFGKGELNYMTEREERFSQKFAPYIHEGNIIPLSAEFEQAYSDIARNGNARIIFTDLCIKVMQNIRP